MNNPDHISESLETIFWVKIIFLISRALALLFFVAKTGLKKFGPGIRDGKNSDPG
jgi:hypothetical protein